MTKSPQTKPIDNYFQVECRICSYEGDLKEFINEIDLWVEPQTYLVQHKEATVKCPRCGRMEIFDKSPAW